MKYCQVKINKNRSNLGTSYIYPEGYDPYLHQVIYYENKGQEIEHCVSMVPNDFDFSQAGYAELTEEKAGIEIDDYIDNDKDLILHAESEHATLDDLKNAIRIKCKNVAADLAKKVQ